MTELELLKRKIILKKQMRDEINKDIFDLQLKYFLNSLKRSLENQIKKNFDLVISRKLDCLTYLMEN